MNPVKVDNPDDFLWGFCKDATDYPTSLTKNNYYRIKEDLELSRQNQVYVLDDSYNWYVYPSNIFVIGRKR